ncbi:helix-turn-helix transcriptional regulator [Trinickia dinghuensis]|uniref:LuxR family transcriptional regulator n=1 Tax=Trinickia dinghuensis TaxID=2291023 RepID=A0A3D8JS68_9BURK|nr:LuxR C-terminal-related transcriptional regulator [Trinickia dinghuensis]RDU95887.1 LuxR family transcriptional regulator [Trinickia dinghuensis]
MTTLIDSAIAEYLLKTTAPRPQPHLLMRERLGSDGPSVRDYAVVVVQAPAGYGKTSLFSQWRREQLARGVAVIWFSSDERDDAQRFLLGLVQAVRSGCARPAFGRLLMDGGIAALGELEGITAWLAEVSQLPGDVLLIVDEAERLPEAGRAALAYVLHNAPRNLRIVVAARRGFDDIVGDLLAYGQAVLIGPDRLSFRLDETIALIGKRFGPRIDADACARLVQLTDGWPLGLQLALSAMTRAADPLQIIEAMASNTGALRDHLVGALLANLSDDDKAFLTCISIVDTLHPALCEALTGDARSGDRLARLMRETPVFVTSEASAWSRLHTLVREVLMVRAARLSDEELVRLHSAAAAWLSGQRMIEEAARHAHAAGQLQTAYDLAEACLHDAVKQGRLQAVLDWLDLLPEAELERRPRLRLAAAWALALGERHREAEQQVGHISAGQEEDRALRYECALILSAAAYYADEIDRFVEIFSPWIDQPPESGSWLVQAHANRLAARAIALGEPAQARRQLQRMPRGDVGKGVGFLVRWGDHIGALSYLWEGQIRLAGEILTPALASAEADLGRRHPLTCMLAAMAALHAYESDHADRAAALLANRLDVLERSGTPETVAIAYATAARVAAAQGQEHRAVDVLEALYAMGVMRALPRLCIVSLAEQIRLHAGHYRGATCEALMHRLDGAVAQAAPRHGPLWQRVVTPLVARSRARAAMASQNWPLALEALGETHEPADAQTLGRDRIEFMALRALALDRAGREGRALLLEAMNLAQAGGLARTLADAHPALMDWILRIAREEGDAGHAGYAASAPPVAHPAAPRAPSGPRAVPTVVLTPKEREILELLARNFSNKEIAVAAAIGEGTVKWHLKNLFGKLDASSRKHVVRRALVLGLLEGA